GKNLALCGIRVRVREWRRGRSQIVDGKNIVWNQVHIQAVRNREVIVRLTPAPKFLSLRPMIAERACSVNFFPHVVEDAMTAKARDVFWRPELRPVAELPELLRQQVAVIASQLDERVDPVDKGSGRSLGV